MVSISFHVISLVIGFFIGMLGGGFIFAMISVSDQWHQGFSNGYNSHVRYMEKVLGKEEYINVTLAKDIEDLNKKKEVDHE